MTETIIALDFESKNEVAAFLAQFPQDQSLFLKVGMELFYQEGGDIIRWLKAANHRIFLDLKLHDIPNTVEKAMRQLAKLEIDLTNVHAAGGREMMLAAKSGLATTNHPSKLIAVTQLTSTSQVQMQKEQGIPTTLEESVLNYARLTHAAGLDGVVCSALEASQIKQATTTEFLTITPGIRLDLAQKDDQQRIVTPKKARELHADYLVMGRTITQSATPFATYQTVLKQLEDN